MQVHAKLLGIAVILVASIESKPSWPDFYLGNYASDAITLQQPQLLHYQQHNPYYYVPADLNTVPATVIANSKPTIPQIPQIPTYSFYYGHPIFDFRFPVSPLYPTVKPVEPDVEPKATPPTTTTAPPTEEKDGGIEKLDNKVEPDKETKKSNEEDTDDDTVVIESI